MNGHALAIGIITVSLVVSSSLIITLWVWLQFISQTRTRLEVSASRNLDAIQECLAGIKRIESRLEKLEQRRP